MSVLESQVVPFHRALIEQEEIDAVLDVLNSGWLTTGPKTHEFEVAFARYLGASHALAVSSCTAALELALAAIGIQEGDEIILPTMTFAATGEVILHLKAVPVLVDCESSTMHIAADEVERAITRRTRAIIPVHYAGAPCDMDRLLEIGNRKDLRVIEDAAHALPTGYKNRLIGTLGDITCFSFYATKTLTTGEGGMATTEHEDYAERMRILSLHGISKDAWKRYSAQGTWRYDIIEAGYKFNLTDMQAALGLAQLAKCDAMCERRAAVARRYTESLKSLDAFEVPRLPGNGTHSWHLYPIRINPPALRIHRDRVIEELKQKGIGTSVHFIPLHLHSFYRTHFKCYAGQFPNAERFAEQALSLPIFPSMTKDDVDRVIESLQEIARDFGR